MQENFSDESMDEDFELNSSQMEDEDEDDPDVVEDEDDLEDIEDNSVSSFQKHTDSVYCVSTNPTNPLLVATGGGDDRAFIWSLQDSSVVAELGSHSDTVNKLKFNTQGNILATAGMEGLVILWSSPDWRKIHSLTGPGGSIEWIDWHPAGNVILAGSEDTTVWMWSLSSNMQNANCLNVFAGHSGPVTCGRFTPSGKQVVTASQDGSLRLWNPKTAACEMVIQGNEYHQGPILSLACHSNNQLMITGSEDHSTAVVNVNSKRIFGLLRGHTDSVESLALSETFSLLATGSLDATVKIWDLNTLQLRSTLNHEGGIVKVLWDQSESSPLIYAASLDRRIKVWDARTGDWIHTFSGHLQHVLDFEITSDGRHLVSASDDSLCLVYKLESDPQAYPQFQQQQTEAQEENLEAST